MKKIHEVIIHWLIKISENKLKHINFINKKLKVINVMFKEIEES